MRPLFETGTMAGLMDFFSRHSRIITNFKIYIPESRHIGVRGGISECGEPRCAEGPGRALECLGGRRYACLATGWALAIPMCGLGSTPVYHPPGTHPVYHPSGTHPATRPVPVQAMHRTGASAVTRGLESPKEILGVDNAHDQAGIAQPPGHAAVSPDPALRMTAVGLAYGLQDGLYNGMALNIT